MTRKELIDYCLPLPFVYEDYPFDDILDAGAWTVMRHQTNKKSFALIYERHGKLCANKAIDLMAWVGHMNSIKAQVEEVIKAELIYE